jgi:hypothetical protein
VRQGEWGRGGEWRRGQWRSREMQRERIKMFKEEGEIGYGHGCEVIKCIEKKFMNGIQLSLLVGNITWQ